MPLPAYHRVECTRSTPVASDATATTGSAAAGGLIQLLRVTPTKMYRPGGFTFTNPVTRNDRCRTVRCGEADHGSIG